MKSSRVNSILSLTDDEIKQITAREYHKLKTRCYNLARLEDNAFTKGEIARARTLEKQRYEFSRRMRVIQQRYHNPEMYRNDLLRNVR